MRIKKNGKPNGHGGKRNGAGGPAFVATDQERWMVSCLKAGGMSNVKIAYVLRPGGIPESTLRKHYKHELEHGMDDVFSELLQKLINKAMSGEWQPMRFLFTHRFGFSETIVVDSNVHLAAEKDLRDDFERSFDRIAAAEATAKGTGTAH